MKKFLLIPLLLIAGVITASAHCGACDTGEAHAAPVAKEACAKDAADCDKDAAKCDKTDADSAKKAAECEKKAAAAPAKKACCPIS
ncbi:MAG: hypothetical protein ACI8Z5_000606 [Lentimonas sp.]|jgi:hypothetical protein